jgi:hypothetical protein
MLVGDAEVDQARASRSTRLRRSVMASARSMTAMEASVSACCSSEIDRPWSSVVVASPSTPGSSASTSASSSVSARSCHRRATTELPNRYQYRVISPTRSTPARTRTAWSGSAVGVSAQSSALRTSASTAAKPSSATGCIGPRSWSARRMTTSWHQARWRRSVSSISPASASRSTANR